MAIYLTVHSWGTWSGNNAPNQSVLLLWAHFWQGEEDAVMPVVKNCFSFVRFSWSPSVMTDNPSRPAHFQDGAWVWCVLWQPLGLRCSREPSCCMRVFKPWTERDGLRSFPDGVWPPHDASCNPTSSARGSPLPALYSYLHITPRDHLTDRYFCRKWVVINILGQFVGSGYSRLLCLMCLSSETMIVRSWNSFLNILTSHFQYTFLLLGWTPFCLQSCFNSLWLRFNVLGIFLRGFGLYPHVGVTQLLQFCQQHYHIKNLPIQLSQVMN